MLQFESSWRFASPGPAPQGVVRAFYRFIENIASQGNSWGIAERFKSCFSGAAGSSSERLGLVRSRRPDATSGRERAAVH